MRKRTGSAFYSIGNSLAAGLTVLGIRTRRVGVQFTLDGDWVCEFLGADFREYYASFAYQHERRGKASAAAREALGIGIPARADLGVAMDASIYGCPVKQTDTAPPSPEPAVDSPARIPGLIERMDSEPDLLRLGLVPRYFEWREKLFAKTGALEAAGLTVKGPATIAAQITGMTEFGLYLAAHPGPMLDLVRCIERTTIRYIRALRRKTLTPGLGLAVANDMAGLISPQMYDHFFKATERNIFQALAPIRAARYYHADSRMNHQLENLNDIEPGIVNLGPSLTVEEIRRRMPSVVIAGHIPPIEVLWQGTPQQVLETGVRNIADALSTGGRIILSTAGSVNPGTRFENLNAMMRAPLVYRERFHSSGGKA